jgi:hypothetical protein
MTKLKSGKLPRPPLDLIQSALIELKRIPAADRYAKGQDFLRTIIEEVLKRPQMSGAIEEAALLCGKGLVEAMDLRAEVERASSVKPEAPPLQREIVRVLTDPDVVLRARGSGEPTVVSDYNPFSSYWMGKR